MATSNDPPSPGSQALKAGYGYDDEWRQMEDHEWPTQLISSIEHGNIELGIADLPDPHLGPQDHVDSRAQVEADEAIFNGIVSGGSGQSSREASQGASQGAPLKVLTRPASSGKDPAAGFSFTKAKPMQQFDFRRPKQNPVVPQSQGLIRPSRGVHIETHSPPLPDTTQAAQNPGSVAAHQGPLPEHHDTVMLKAGRNPVSVAAHQEPSSEHPYTSVLKAGQNPVNVAAHQGPLHESRDTSVVEDPCAVPFPNVIPANSRAYNHTTRNTNLLKSSSSGAPPNEVSMSGDDTLTDSVLNGVKLTTTALVSGHSPIEMVRFAGKPPVNLHNHSRKSSRDLLTSVAGVSKITKSRRRNLKTGPATGGPNPKDSYTEDDLLKLFMYRRRQGYQELEYLRATLPQKEDEIQKLRDVSNDLSGQLQEVIQRESQKTAELSKLSANKSIWESKIKRLSDYARGLTNDQKRLREDADDLHKQHEDFFLARKELLEAAQKSAEQERTRSQQLEEDARHRIETLAQTIQHQNFQLRSDETLLMAERERSNRLEEQISRVTTASHGQLLELFTSHRDKITGKIDDLINQVQSIVPLQKASESHDPIGPMLEQCVGILQELHKADTVKPEDLWKLNDTMDSFVQGIARSVEACEESSNSVEAEQKQLALTVQDQLRALNGKILSEQVLSAQINDLREVKATVRERLQATESSLADARQELVALRLKDQEQLRRIETLETDAARAHSQPAEAPQTLLRIQELDSRNRDLQSEIVTLRKEATDLSGQLQQGSTDAREMTERLATTQGQLEAAHEETSRLREENSKSERQAMFDREQLRKDFSNAANMQLASIQSEHMNVVQQLRLEKSPAEEKLKNATRQVNMLKAEKQKSEKEVAQLQALLKGAQSEKEAVIGTRDALQLHLKRMEGQMGEKNNEFRDVKAMLDKANDKVKAKNMEIMALQASQASRPSSSRVIEQSSSVRGGQSTRNGHALLRDSHHASINQGPSIQSTKSRSSRQYTIRPAIIEDSQPTEKPAFVSLDDLMLEDPFAGYTQEGSQTIAGEEISHLFPSTPGAGSRAKDLDYSRNSVFHTTVVSETQRRHNQLFREATPHNGTLTTDKSHTQQQARPQPKAARSYTMPRSSAANSPTIVSARRHDTGIPSSHREASITRESTQPQGNVKDPRQGKRNTVAAGFSDTNSHARPSKVPKAEPSKQTKALGPIIEDSQSPLLNGRSRKMTRRKSSAPKGEGLMQSFWTMLKDIVLDDKYTRRFAQL